MLIMLKEVFKTEKKQWKESHFKPSYWFGSAKVEIKSE